MISKKTSISSLIFYLVLLLLLIKFTFAYLNVELGWWLRHLTPNIEKYNFLNLSKNFQEQVEYVLIPLMLLYVLFNINKLGLLLIPFCLTILMYCFNLGTSFFNSVDLVSSLKYSLRVCAPVYLFMILKVEHKKEGIDLRHIMAIFIKYCSFLAIIGLLFFDVSFNRGREYLPVFFNSIHTHSYVMALIFIGFSLLLRKRYWLQYSFMILSFAFLTLGYNVRTSVVFYFIFIVVMLFQSSNIFKYFFIKVLMYIPFLIGALLFFMKDFNLDAFSSGRITMYLKKLDILENYKIKDFLFGRGFGSDLVTTSEWDWTVKGSHNDFLTYLVENGIPFTLMFLVLMISLLTLSRKVSIFSICLVGGYLATSAISNGLAVRPLAGYLFFIIFAYTTIMHYSEQEEITK